MGSTDGFIRIDRRVGVHQSKEERIKHYNEFHTPPDEEVLRGQGARCMDCGIPFCHTNGCPNGNLIPEWNDLVYRGEWFEAYQRLKATSCMPEITGRICPAPCETSCTLAINSAPVSIKEIELAIAERAFEEGWVVPEKPSREIGKSVAIVGSGPAGLSAAKVLRQAGCRVTVFEKSDRIGGLLRYGVPNFKLEKEILDRRLEVFKEEGIEFESEVCVGDDISSRYLKRSHDAILLAMGAGTPRDTSVDGRELEGVVLAMDYLTASIKSQCGLIKLPSELNAEGKRVLVIGSGDTGSDCIGTAIRQGAAEVRQHGRRLMPPEWNEPWNPEWPEWPEILRTSSSQEEGCIREWEVSTRGFSGSGGVLDTGHFVRLEWVEDAKTGRLVQRKLPNGEFSIPLDMVILAMGFMHVEQPGLVESLGLVLDSQGNIATDPLGRSSDPAVWAAGDCHFGASLVITAMNSGRTVATEMLKQLLG